MDQWITKTDNIFWLNRNSNQFMQFIITSGLCTGPTPNILSAGDWSKTSFCWQGKLCDKRTETASAAGYQWRHVAGKLEAGNASDQSADTSSQPWPPRSDVTTSRDRPEVDCDTLFGDEMKSVR